MGTRLFTVFLAINFMAAGGLSGQKTQLIGNYVEIIKQKGVQPVQFVNQAIMTHDLVVFDDALHNAYEPFQFYIQLLHDKDFQKQVKYVFLEAFGINAQPYIDRYLDDQVKDSNHLLKVFQDNFSGYGWRYQTYLDLLSAVWDINQQLPQSDRIKIIGVDQPIYWEGIHTRQDYEIFQHSLAARDYFMYKILTSTMENFAKGKKGIFLTNTRHAYKGIKNSEGNFYWNATTFLSQFHPGKVYSIRIHNVSLYIESKKQGNAGKTTEGLDRVSYRWVRMEDGIWDKAFNVYGNKAVAVPLRGNVFGHSRYIGNHMLDVQQGQTMQDAYDAVVFLAPLEELHFSAQIDFIYTPQFREELKRRIMILSDGDLDTLLRQQKVESIEAYIEKLAHYVPMQKNTFSSN